jgi:hypothetical protein
MGQHLCYQRKSSKNLKTVPRKYFFMISNALRTKS